MIELSEIEHAQRRIRGAAVRTPLVRFPLEPTDVGLEPPPEIWLKLETLQPVNSFKIRGAVSVIRDSDPAELERGLVTCSTGNLARAVAAQARELAVPATVIVPDHAPASKLAVIERLGARIIAVPLDRWWQALAEHGHPEAEGLFIDPEDPRLIAGNGTLGLELLEDLPDLDAVIVPYGGGALAVGIARAVKALRPRARVYSVEPETAAPASAAFAAGGPVAIDYAPSWVDGCGGFALLPNMWPMVHAALDGGFAVTLPDAAAAVKLLAERIKVIAEGAGALALAAALSGRVEGRKIVCVVSGGNIDIGKVRTILAGDALD